MSLSVGEIGLDLTVNKGTFNKDIVGIKKLAAKTGVALASAFTVKKIAGFVKDTTAAGSALNAMNDIVSAALPNMKKQVDEFAQSSGHLFGLSETQSKKYIGSFAAMAKGFQFTEKQAFSMSTTLAGLAGDMASFYHIDSEDAYTKLTSIFSGETESLKSLGIIMSQNALDQYALANGFGKTTTAMSEQEKVALRYRFVMEQLSLANGDFAKYSMAWGNQLKILNLNWSNFTANVGQGIINILLPLLQTIVRISNALTTLGARFKGWTEKITGKKTGGAVQNTMNNIATSAGGASAGIGDVGKSAKKAANDLKKAQKSLMGFDEMNKLSENLSTSASGGSAGGGAGGISDLGNFETPQVTESTSGGLFDGKKYKELRKSIVKLKEAFAELGSVAKKYGKWIFDNWLKPLGEYLATKVSPKVIEFFAATIRVLANVLKILAPILDLIWKGLKPIVKLIGAAFVKLLEKSAKGMENLADNLGALANSKLFKNAIKGIKSFGKELSKNIKDGAIKITAKIGTKWSQLKGDWNNLTKNIKDKNVEIKAKIATKWSDLKSKWEEITNNIKDKTADMKAKIASKWSDLKTAWNNLLDKFKGKTVNIALKFSAAARILKNGLIPTS